MSELNSWLHSTLLQDTITNPNIKVGRFTYYSGYYHKERFEDTCVRYLLGDKSTKNYQELFGEDFEFDQLIIGSFCSLASGVSFMLAGNQGHRHDWISAYPFDPAVFSNAKNGFQRKNDTVIGHDVWIGTEAMIMPGVTIGNGAVIASRSVVTKDVPPYAVVGGNPATIIKYRFTEDEITKLQTLCWWDWSVEQINDALLFINSKDVDDLFNYYQTHIK